MKTTTIDYGSLFRKFCGTNPMRPVLQSPSRQGDYYFASDGHTLLMMNVSEAELDFKVTDSPNFIAVVPTNLHEPKIINVQRLVDVLKAIPLVESSEDCNECDGSGTQECNLGYDHECETCKGLGEIKDSSKMVPDKDGRVELFGQLFKSGYVERMVIIAMTLGAPEFAKISGADRKAGLFSIGPMTALLMPHMNDDEKEFVKYVP